MFLNLWNIHLFESFSHVHFQLNSYKKWKLGDMIGINFEEKWKLLQVSIFIFAKVSPLSLCWFNLFILNSVEGIVSIRSHCLSMPFAHYISVDLIGHSCSFMQ